MTSFLVRWECDGAEQDAWAPEVSMLDPVHLQECDVGEGDKHKA